MRGNHIERVSCSSYIIRCLGNDEGDKETHRKELKEISTIHKNYFEIKETNTLLAHFTIFILDSRSLRRYQLSIR